MVEQTDAEKVYEREIEKRHKEIEALIKQEMQLIRISLNNFDVQNKREDWKLTPWQEMTLENRRATSVEALNKCEEAILSMVKTNDVLAAVLYRTVACCFLKPFEAERIGRMAEEILSPRKGGANGYCH